jgi:hypothetical protein
MLCSKAWTSNFYPKNSVFLSFETRSMERHTQRRHELVACVRWEGLASAVLMSAQVILHAPKAVRERLLQPVLTTLFPWTLHHHHSLRQAHHSLPLKSTLFCHIITPEPNQDTPSSVSCNLSERVSFNVLEGYRSALE